MRSLGLSPALPQSQPLLLWVEGDHLQPCCPSVFDLIGFCSDRVMMIDFYCFENTHKTNRFDCDWGTKQKRYKNKNIIIITSKESRVDHDDDGQDEDI